MKVTVVTGYVEIDNTHRSPETYRELGAELVAAVEEAGVPIFQFMYLKESLWLRELVDGHLGIRHAEYNNPGKNTLDYHAVQHQKTEWIAKAAAANGSDVLVWIDYGIFHQKGVTRSVVVDFLERARYANPDAVASPGAWSCHVAVPLEEPCWRFLGSLLVVPTSLAFALDREVKASVLEQIQKHDLVNWEVNTWARLEKEGRIPFDWYAANHDASMFDNFRPEGPPSP